MIGRLKKHILNTFIKNHLLVPIAPRDIRNGINDPRMLNYTGNHSILINARRDDGRCFQIMKLNEESNPFVRALKRSAPLNKEDKKDFIRESIQSYYTNYQPESALERFELNRDDAPDLECEPAWAAPMPWSANNIKSEKIKIIRGLQEDHQMQGQDLDMTHGHQRFGPVSSQKLKLETERFLQIYESIDHNGYNRQDTNDGDIGATIFISQKGEWRWLVRRGQHRSIALSALDYELIPVRVKKIVYESEVRFWPNVRSGLYTRRGAEKMFELFFEGRSF